MLNFSISEFNITGQPIPEEIADKILLYHLWPMQYIRDIMGIPIWPSEKSGYRPVWWEQQHKRNGNSQHTFKDKGATDWTCKDFKDNKAILLDHIIKHTNYTRIAIYDTFIHCDYKQEGKRELYQSNAASNWTLLQYV